MATVKEITSMCREGQILEGYEKAVADLEQEPDNVWNHRKVGWALYYSLNADAVNGNYESFIEHLDKLKSLNLLTMESDNMIFDNVAFAIGRFVRNHVGENAPNSSAKLSTIFQWLRDYHFNPSKGYSFILQSYVRFSDWPEIADFFDWWNLDNLTEEDYTPFVNQRGQRMMTLAERAFIANSKALLQLHDRSRVEAFLPRLDNLMTTHTEMTYPGYFYGKLLLSLGSTQEEALRVIIPFARKKATEFWVWQLLSDVFAANDDRRLACLLRAVNCRTQESFLGIVRIKLAQLYISRGQYDHAKFHIDTTVRCYAEHGWRLRPEVEDWVHEPWMTTCQSNGSDPVDYRYITNVILYGGAIGVVTKINTTTHEITFVYDKCKRMNHTVQFRTNPGDALVVKLNMDDPAQPRVVSCERIQLPNGIDYAKKVKGRVDKRPNNNYAFLKTNNRVDYYIPQNVVQRDRLQNNETIRCLVVYDYNERNNNWSWVCIKVLRNNTRQQ